MKRWQSQNNKTAVTVDDFTFQFHSTLSSWHNRYALQVLSPNPTSGQNRLLHATSAGDCGWRCPDNKNSVSTTEKKWPNTVKNYIHNTYLDFSLPHKPRNIAATCWMFFIHLLNEHISLVHVNSICLSPLHMIHKTNHFFSICNRQSHNKIIIWLNAWASFLIHMYITNIKTAYISITLSTA